MTTTLYTSKDLSMRLREIGVPQKSEFYWEVYCEGEMIEKRTLTMTPVADIYHKVYSAYSFSELWTLLKERLPKKHGIRVTFGAFNEIEWFELPYQYHPKPTTDNIANDLGLMLEYLVKEGVIKL